VTATLICEAEVRALGAGAVPDGQEATEALQREVARGITEAPLLGRVAAREQIDAGDLSAAVRAREVRDSRLVEIGVALPDVAQATRVCNDLVDLYLAGRMKGVLRPADVRVSDRCAAAGARAPRR